MQQSILSNIGESIQQTWIQNRTIQKLFDKIEADKKEVISQAFEKLTSDELNWEEEAARRFKRFVIENHQDSGIQIWYFDDGSVEGRKLVTFRVLPSEYDWSAVSSFSHKIEMSFEIHV